MNIKVFDYLMESVKDDLQGCANFSSCTEVEEKLTVAFLFVMVIVVRIKRNYVPKILNALIIRCNLKGNYNYTRKSNSYTKLY